MKIIDLLGKQFHNLKVLEKVILKERVHWKCLCACNKITVVRTDGLTRGTSKSCGCNKSKNGKHKKMNRYKFGFSCIYRTYKKAAKQRNLFFNLTKEESMILFKNNCHYCNSEPKNISIPSYIKNSAEDIEKYKFIYSGIDRIDSSKGYEISNCVSCCIKCNRAKSAMSYEEFKSLVKNIHNNMKLGD